jgi:hypothetical protein
LGGVGFMVGDPGFKPGAKVRSTKRRLVIWGLPHFFAAASMNQAI